jgi:hypothetical protein
VARTTHVKKAQQRYETKPVLDEFGNQVETAVMKTVTDRETGEKKQVQKTTKRGKAIFMKVTERDLSKPLPLETCDACRQPIEVGTPYKHITPKSGPYGGRKRSRHEGCPSWQVWDYSNSLSAQLARISYDFWGAVDSAESTDDIQSALDDAASSVNEIAEQKKESASNIEEGFGHPTSSSEQLEEIADGLESWASEIETADIPEMTTCEDCTDGQMDCDDCEGTGKVETDESAPDLVDCDECNGTGTRDCDNCDGTGEDIDAWRDEVRDNVTIVDEAP